MAQRQTNIDVSALAGSSLVRAYMWRILDEVTDPLTGHVFAVTLAKHAADAFDLYDEDSRFPRSLVDVATEVIMGARSSRLSVH